MFRYCSLYSGSSGNSFYVGTNTTNIIIDAGVSLKKITDALEKINVQGESIDVILVTHDHIDHTKSIAALSNKYNIPVYANKKTWEAIPDIENNILNNNKKTFDVFKLFSIGDIDIFPFRTPHDAADPCGFNLYNCGKKLSVATDLGSVTDEILNYLQKSSSLLIEANYEDQLLKLSRYPYMLKQRILSNTGHLSNSSAAKVINELYKTGLNNALLIHLSKENNFPDIAYETIKSETLNCKNLSIDIAPRDKPSKLFNVV